MTRSNNWHQRGPTDANRIRGRAWMTIRARIFARDGWQCVVCTKVGKVTLATICDHVVPLSKGGSNEDSNLASLCGDHARAKDKADGVRVGRVKRRISVDGWPVDE